MPATSDGRYRRRLPTPLVDYEALHRYWWRRADRRGRVAIRQRQLCQDLDIHRETMRRVVEDMTYDGRIRFDYTKGRISIYQIADPDLWDPKDPSTYVEARDSAVRGAPAWG